MSALEVSRLTHDFGGLRALDDVSLEAQPGERLVVLGPNGAGKTTLFNAITGLLRPASGRIRLHGEEISRLAPHARAQRGLGRTFQITTLFPGLSVLDSVLLAVQGRDRARFAFLRPQSAFPHLLERALALLAEWDLIGRGNMPTRLLSYGEQRQVELILALAVRPRVLLLDEPTAGLSPAETATVADIIRRFPRDLTLLFIEHDMDVALDLADRVVVLHQGRVLAAGSPEEIRRDPRVAETYLGASHA